MRRPRMIATDLDGTLLGPDGLVSDRTRSTLESAAAAGFEVVAATGRSHHSALPKLAGVDAVRWIVCSNGAAVWDRRSERRVLHRPINGRLAHAVMCALRRGVPDVAIGWETGDGYGFDANFLNKPLSINEYGLRGDIAEPGEDTDVTKLVISVRGVTGSVELETVLRPHLPSTVTAAASGATFVETTAAGVTKATTLAMLIEQLGVRAADVAAFGDQHNDVDMLRWAGTGVAMSNAQPDVLAVADHVAPSNEEDGVAAVIESWLAAGRDTPRVGPEGR